MCVQTVKQQSNIPTGDAELPFSGRFGGGSGSRTPRYCRSMVLFGSRQLNFKPTTKKTDIKRSQGERNIHMTCTKIYSTTWMFMCICKDSPSCSTGWMTCLCLRVWRSCSKIASKRAIFSSSVSGMTFTETPQKGFQNV